MAPRLVPFALLTGASVMTLPVLYTLVRSDLEGLPRFAALGLGLLSMGLAWAAGVSLEDRRQGSVTLVCALAVLSPLVALVPSTSGLFDALGSALLLACAGLALVAIFLLRARWTSPAG